MKRPVFIACIAAVAVAALALRTGDLARRPMHTDEAVHAVKLGDLLEGRGYRYNPHEFHGPTLNYLTLPIVRAAGVTTFADSDQWHYRIVPVVFGVGLVVGVWLVADGLGRAAAVAAAVLTAASPAMVFYSGYYIQEMLLVCFSLGAIGCGWRYVRSRSIGWAIATGASLGLMHATKETCVIAMGAMVLGLVVVRVWSRGEAAREAAKPQAGATAIRTSIHILMAVATGVVVSVVFYSSFFTHGSGVWDSVRALGTYLSRAGGVGSAAGHEHLWHYYLGMLAFFRHGGGPVWSEGMILVLAVVGVVAAVRGKGLGDGSVRFVRFVAVYAVAVTAVYSAIPYKTPWTMLGALHGMILLAGVGTAALLRWMPNTLLRVGACAVLLAAGAHLCLQADRATGRYCDHPRNPYVYAHTSPDILRLAPRLQVLAELDRMPGDMQVHVIAPGKDYWPLPWYLRRLKKAEVGYFPRMADTPGAAVLIVHHNAPKIESAGRFAREYADAGFYGLRPDVPMRLYVRRPLWEKFTKLVDAAEAERQDSRE